MRGGRQSRAERRAEAFAGQFAALPQVVAVALGGSRSSGVADLGSDMNLYVCTDAEVPPAAHATLIKRAGGATRADVGLPYSGGVNTWTDALWHHGRLQLL